MDQVVVRSKYFLYFQISQTVGLRICGTKMDSLNWVGELYKNEGTAFLKFDFHGDWHGNAFVSHGFSTAVILFSGWVLFCLAIDVVS